MIPFQEIAGRAKGIPPEIVERDYCTTWLLYGLSESQLQKDLIFYGGTALKKIYFPNFRFSEDLDFLSEKDITAKSILVNLNKVYANLREKVNIHFAAREETVTFKENRLQFFVGYDGFPEISFTKQIKFDLFLKQRPLEKAFPKEIISTYSDRKEVKGKLRTYSLEAIAAEKLSAIFDLTRKEPRDLYDLNYLLKRSKLNCKEVVVLLKKKHGFIPPLSSLLSNLKSNIYRQRWEMRLGNQVVKLEEIDKTLNNLKSSLIKLYSNGKN